MAAAAQPLPATIRIAFVLDNFSSHLRDTPIGDRAAANNVELAHT
jgi:hypothetical protein